MPATPIYALPYPAPADPADVPLDMQELAERIEAVLPTLVPQGELAYAEFTANVTVTNVVVTLVTLPALNFDGTTPVLFQFQSQALVPPNIQAASVSVSLYDGGTVVGAFAIGSQAIGTGVAPALPAGLSARRVTPSAGSHTYSARAVTSVAQAGIVQPGWLRAVRA